MVVEQRIGRIQRLGSSYANVNIWNLIGKNTVEDLIVGKLLHKLHGVSQALGDIEGILGVSGIDDDSDGEKFGDILTRMVLDSLAGKDVEKYRKEIEKNIEDAINRFEDERKKIDEMFKGSKKKSFEVPKISVKPPKISAEDFVLGVFCFDNYRIEELGNNIFEASKPGFPKEQISFVDDFFNRPPENAFTGQPVHTYLPGKPKFERLVQHWVDHHAHFIQKVPDNSLEEFAFNWCSKQSGWKYVSVRYEPTENHFSGKLHVFAKAINGVDSYEKNLEIEITPKGHHGIVEIRQDNKSLDENLTVNKATGCDCGPIIQNAVESDSDINLFCDFYIERLNDGLQETDGSEDGKRKVDQDFRPFVYAEARGLNGHCYTSGKLFVSFSIEGHVYETVFSVVPASGSILEQPIFVKCQVSQINAPKECFETCCSSKKQVLRHLLTKTQDGKFCLDSELVVCQVTGESVPKSETLVSREGLIAKKVLFQKCPFTKKMLLPSEMGTSDVSGRKGDLRHLVKSSLSDRKGFPEEMAICSRTAGWILKSEGIQAKKTGRWFGTNSLADSELSSRKGPPDDLVACAVCGLKAFTDEQRECKWTKQIVCPSHLIQSDAVSGEILKSIAVTTNDGLVAPKDLIHPCEKSGGIYLRQGLEECSVTKKLVLPKFLSRSDASGLKALPECFQTTDDDKIALPEEIGVCLWSERRVLLKHLKKCALTGVSVDKQFLSKNGAIKALDDLYNIYSQGNPVPFATCIKIKTNPGLFCVFYKRPRRIFGPSSSVYALVFEAEIGVWNGKLMIYGAILKSDGNREKLQGNVVSREVVYGE